jgi:hypothetical protein
MKMITKLLISAAAAGFLTAAPASAASIIGLYNTGVDASGNKVTTVNTPELHYTSTSGAAFTTNNPNYLTDPNASFIAGGLNGSGGSQTYALAFDLGALNPTTASLSGQLAYDNGAQVYLNGNLLFSDLPASPGTLAAFQTLHSFNASSSYFVAGINTLTFSVLDYQAPTGLLVTNLVGTGAVPEPATWAMMLAGFGMIGFGLRRRVKRTVSVTYA